MTSPEPSTSTNAKTITDHELEQCQRASQTGRTPVVFVHGLWLLPSSWDRWAALLEDNGYAALTPGGRTTPRRSRRPRPIPRCSPASRSGTPSAGC
jgi:non-heme chloroperoxidase